MRIIGVDPGNAVTGFGIIDAASPQRFGYVAAGTIRPGPADRGPGRIATIYDRLIELIGEYAPGALSLERNFVALNIRSAFKIGEARAVAMLAAAKCDLALFEYTPTEVKLAVAGYGRADKGQVKAMVRRTLNLDPAVELADDGADALALALCHVFRSRIPVAPPTADASGNSRRRAARLAQP